MMCLDVFASGPADTNTYLLSCSKTKAAAIIDTPPESSQWLLSEIQAQGLEVKMILLTHSHWDHIADSALLKEKLKVPLYVHAEDAPNVQSPGTDGLRLFFPISPCTVDGFLTDHQKISVGHLSLEVIHTPGHTPGGVCFYLEREKTLISGDTLFQGTIGRLNFPGSSPAKMWASLKRLALLPKDTKVYPGHGDPTTLAEESWIANAEKRFTQGSS